MELRDRPVFICGHPKAGTTLLRNLLDSHPQLVVFPEETLFFRRFLRKAEGLDSQALIDLAEQELVAMFGDHADLPTNPYGDSHQGYTDISVEKLKARLSTRTDQDGVRHPGDVLSALVLAFGDLVGYPVGQARWWVEKTPYNEQFTEQILKWWPNARFIHIVRDPCDNFASYQRKHRDWDAGFFASNWNRSTAAGMQNRRQLGPKKYLVMPYEHLAQSPEEKLAEICAFLEIADHPTLRQPTKRGQPWRGNSMFDDKFNAISAAAIGRWQSVLTREEAAVIQLTTRKYRRALGYRQESPKTIRAWFNSLYWRLHPVLYDLVKGPKKDW
jgi:hypothetical protein